MGKKTKRTLPSAKRDRSEEDRRNRLTKKRKREKENKMQKQQLTYDGTIKRIDTTYNIRNNTTENTMKDEAASEKETDSSVRHPAVESGLYPVERKWQSESRPPPVVEVAPPSPVKQTSLQPVLGLTIYMHPPHVLKMDQYGPLMVLFESFHRSNVNFSFNSSTCSNNGLPCEQHQPVGHTGHWKTNLFIEGKLVSSGTKKKELKSKKAAAEKALAILRECQPVHVNLAQETFYTRNEIIPGLVLHFKDSRQAGKKQKTEWYDVLVNSCRKCGLEVSWWENFGAVFQTKWLVVLLINSKPMSVSWADTLEDAKREAGTTAVSMLKLNHSLKFENKLKSVYLKYPGEEKVTDPYRILQRSALMGGNRSFHMRDRIETDVFYIRDCMETDEGAGNTTFSSHLYMYNDLFASGTGPSKAEAQKNAANHGLQKLMLTLPVVIYKELGGNVVSEVHINNHSHGVNKRKYGGETLEGKGSFVMKSELPMDYGGALLLSNIKDSIDTHTLIKKYIARYVDS